MLVALLLGCTFGFFIPEIISFTSNYINKPPKAIVGDIRGMLKSLMVTL